MQLQPYLIYQDNVFHCGNLKKEERKSYSLEGNGLSISPCPKAWKTIHRIQSNQIIKLPSDYFIDMLKIHQDHKLIQTIKEYALQEGLCLEKEIYSVSYFDDELNSNLTSYHLTLEEAREESFYEDDNIQKEIQLQATQKLIDYFEQKDIPLCLTQDFIIIYYFIHKFQYYKFFWDEDLDINSFSAPRGVIFNFDVEKDKYTII